MIVTVRLNLPKIDYKVLLHYNTFEKVSYDRYLIASFILNSKNMSLIENYIDTITGNGSLNDHFKKLYSEMLNLSKTELESIITNSMYPIQKIDNLSYEYIPLLNTSVYSGMNHFGDLKNDAFFPKYLVPKEGTYIKHEIKDGVIINRTNTYKVKLDNDKIHILINAEFIETTETVFKSIMEKEELDLTSYKGNIQNSFIGDDWMQLTKLNWNNICNEEDFFYYNGDHYSIYNDYVKKTELASVWGIHWIKEKKFNYSDSNSREICQYVAKTLMDTGRINEFKIKSLLEILKNIKRDQQQEIINNVLSNKDSKDLALLGLLLIEKGYEKGWNDRAFGTMFRFKENAKHLMNLYRVNQSFPYSIEDLISINNSDKLLLSDHHQSILKEYYNDIHRIANSINLMVGEIVNSGIRENIGKMPINEDTKKLRKFLNKNIAHVNNDIKNKTLIQLRDYEAMILNNYELYRRVKLQWDNNHD